jgi:hypothetical protein
MNRSAVAGRFWLNEAMASISTPVIGMCLSKPHVCGFRCCATLRYTAAKGRFWHLPGLEYGCGQRHPNPSCELGVPISAAAKNVAASGLHVVFQVVSLPVDLSVRTRKNVSSTTKRRVDEIPPLSIFSTRNCMHLSRLNANFDRLSAVSVPMLVLIWHDLHTFVNIIRSNH